MTIEMNLNDIIASLELDFACTCATLASILEIKESEFLRIRAGVQVATAGQKFKLIRLHSTLSQN